MKSRLCQQRSCTQPWSPRSFSTESRVHHTSVSTIDPKCLNPSRVTQTKRQPWSSTRAWSLLQPHPPHLTPHHPAGLRWWLPLPRSPPGFHTEPILKTHTAVSQMLLPAGPPLSSPSPKDPLNDGPQVSLGRPSPPPHPGSQRGCQLHMSPSCGRQMKAFLHTQ